MDQAELHRKLIAAARLDQPSQSVPYAFEQRVRARLAGLSPSDVWGLWARALWQAAAPCIGIMLLLAAWSLFAPAPKAPGGDLSQAFERTVLAAVESESNVDSTW